MFKFLKKYSNKNPSKKSYIASAIGVLMMLKDEYLPISTLKRLFPDLFPYLESNYFIDSKGITLKGEEKLNTPTPIMQANLLVEQGVDYKVFFNSLSKPAQKAFILTGLIEGAKDPKTVQLVKKALSSKFKKTWSIH